MKKMNYLLLVFFASVFVVGCSQKEQLQVDDESATLKSASASGKYIVVLKEDPQISKADLQLRNSRVKEKALGLLKKNGVFNEIEEIYETALQGFTVKMSLGQLKKMEADPEIKYVEPDRVIALSPIEMKVKPGGGGTQPSQSIPWGISRVGGGQSGSYRGVAWIIDTGIDYSHPDLVVDKSRSKSFVNTATADDDNGHGSHVSGIIGAVDNSIGVLGVAPGATLIAVKVLNRNGSGTTSGVIAGVNYVAANGVSGDVANMSLGGGVSTTLDNAVLNASNVVKFCLAAGNESDDANNHSPARVNGNNILTVSAMAQGDIWAYYSNFGSSVDWCAPGSNIYSTYKGDGYATLSGTSMATPHVAGLLLLGDIKPGGYVSGDPDGDDDPIAHH